MPISGVEYGGPPITTADVDRLEKTMRVQFPASYREFLVTHNGGRPEPEEVFGDLESGSMMNLFYSVSHDNISATLAQQQLAFQDRIPDDLLPIGADMGGSQVCMGIGPDNHGKIYFWSVDDERPSSKRTRRNIWLLADDFASFVETFHEDD